MLKLNVPANNFLVMSGQSHCFLGIIKPQYIFTYDSPRSSRFKLDGKIGVHRDVKKKKEKKINRVSHDAQIHLRIRYVSYRCSVRS